MMGMKMQYIFLLILLGCSVYAYEYYISTLWMLNIGTILTYNHALEL